MSLRTWVCQRLGCPTLPVAPPTPPPAGRGPRIVCINHSTVGLGLPAGRSFADLVGTLQRYVDTLMVPAWNTPATLLTAISPPPGAWALVFLDTADVAQALGYHDLTPDGLPLGKVFTKTTLDAGDVVSVTAAHELAEMLVDPSINLLATGSRAVQDVYAYEVADAVEERPYVILDGLQLSNFVLPTYFEDFHTGKVAYDQLGVLGGAFSLAPGGYMSVLKGGTWTQVFGSVEKERRFANEDRRQHRSELRARRYAGLMLKRSLPQPGGWGVQP